MAKDQSSVDSYLKRLSIAKEKLQPITSEVRGCGKAAFLYITGPAGSAELAEDSDYVWVEFWRPESESPKKNSSFEGYGEAIAVIRTWCTH